MKEEYKDKTKEQLINELVGLRQRIAELEKAKIECKREELEIRNLQRYNRGLIEASLDPLVTFDQRGTILDVNEATVQATGRTREELIGTLFPDYFTDPEKAHKGVMKVFETGEVRDCELVMKAQDRTETVVVYNASVYKDQAGQVAGAFAAARVITERKQAEEALRASVEKYRDLAELLPEVIFETDLEGNITYANQVAFDFFGYTQSDFDKGLNATQMLIPEDRDRGKESIQRVLSGETTGSREYTAQRKDKTTFPVIINSMPIIHENKPVGMRGAITDITERKRSEEEVKKSRKFLDTIIENIPDPLYIKDRQFRFVEVNKAFCRTHKVTKGKEEILGETRYRETDEETFKTGKELEIQEQHYTDAEGNQHWTHLKKVPLTDESGNITHVLTISHDITERKRAEVALATERRRLADIVKGTNVGSWEWNVQTGETIFNERWAEIMGYTLEELAPISIDIWMKLTHPDDIKVSDELLEKHFNGELDYYECEARMRHKNGNWVWVLDRGKVATWTEDGKPLLMSGTHQDITERKHAEEERKQLLKELEAKNTELDRFTYTVSHDLRSPLVTVQGFVEMLRDDFGRDEKEKVESDLKFIEKGTAKMEHLLNDTLRLSRIGRMVNPPEDVLFGEIVQEALEQTAQQIKSSEVEVSVPEDFPTVHVDRMRIVEVLVNLVTNSINYMGEQPRPKIDIGYRVDGEESVFFVRDNGIGIDKSQHEKIFELFYTVDKSGKGTGAGLAIVKRIIEVHNGHIWIESEKGKGCTVCFTLPPSQG